MRFVDGEHGWVAGAGGIWTTVDGGAAWHQQFATNQPVGDLTALDRTRAWAGEGQGLLLTRDGGAHWRLAPSGAGPLTSLNFVTAQQGWAIAPASGEERAGGWGNLLATSDGGENWSEITTPGPVRAACRDTPTRGWIHAGNTIWRTEDDGKTWDSVLVSPAARDGGGSTAGTAGTLGCAGDGVVWVLFQIAGGMMQSGWALYRSPDAGVTWSPIAASGQFFPDIPAPHRQGGWISVGLSVVDGATAYLIGVCAPCSLTGSQEQGTVVVGAVRDAGATWQVGPPLPDLTGSALLRATPHASFATAERGWLVAPGAGRRVWATSDGGQSWRAQRP